MDNNCKSCGHCIMQDSDPSPGGVMLITNYKCENLESSHHGQIMNSITAQGKTLDARENEFCDKWEHPQEAAKKRKREPLLGVVEGATGKGKEFPEDWSRNISIKDVDDTSTIVIRDGESLDEVLDKLERGRAIVAIRDNKIAIGGEEITLPHYVKKGSPEGITILNGNVYVNGWRYKNGLFYRNIFTRLACWI